MRSTRSCVPVATIVALLAMNLLGCALGGSPAIGRQELARRLQGGEAPVVLDVRSEREYRLGHIPGAIHLPFLSAAERQASLGLDPAETVVVTCAHGPRAAWVARALRKAGYQDVLYLDGHMKAWEADGLPMTRGSDPLADEPSETAGR